MLIPDRGMKFRLPDLPSVYLMAANILSKILLQVPVRIPRSKIRNHDGSLKFAYQGKNYRFTATKP